MNNYVRSNHQVFQTYRPVWLGAVPQLADPIEREWKRELKREQLRMEGKALCEKAPQAAQQQ